MEVIKNKLTTLLYGLDGQVGIENKFNEDPTNFNLDIDDHNYMLFDSFSDFMDKLTRFERARIISARALQLSLGAPQLIESPKTTDVYILAEMEFDKKVLPISVLRTYPNGEIKRLDTK